MHQAKRELFSRISLYYINTRAKHITQRCMSFTQPFKKGWEGRGLPNPAYQKTMSRSLLVCFFGIQNARHSKRQVSIHDTNISISQGILSQKTQYCAGPGISLGQHSHSRLGKD
jgi:hypothetical protein